MTFSADTDPSKLPLLLDDIDTSIYERMKDSN